MNFEKNIPKKLPFADLHHLVEKYPRAFISEVQTYGEIYELISGYDSYVDYLYDLAANGFFWDNWFEDERKVTVFRRNFKETSKRLDKILDENLKLNNLSETIVKIKH